MCNLCVIPPKAKSVIQFLLRCNRIPAQARDDTVMFPWSTVVQPVGNIRNVYVDVSFVHAVQVGVEQSLLHCAPVAMYICHALHATRDINEWNMSSIALKAERDIGDRGMDMRKVGKEGGRQWECNPPSLPPPSFSSPPPPPVFRL